MLKVENLSKNIIKFRKLVGISQTQLGELLRVSQDTISLWETGKKLPSLDMFIKLTEILNVSIYDLLEE